AVALRRRARAHAAFTRDRRYRPRGAPWRALLLHDAVDLRARARMAHRQPPLRLRDREVRDRDRDDRDRLSRLRTRTPARRPWARALRRGGVGGDSGGRVLVDDRRGTVRLFLFDPGALPDHARVADAVALVDRGCRPRLGDRAPRARGARSAPGRLPAGRSLPALAIRVPQPPARNLERAGLGGLLDARRRRRGVHQRGAWSPLARMELRDPSVQEPDAGSGPQRRRRVDDRTRRAARDGGAGGALRRTGGSAG